MAPESLTVEKLEEAMGLPRSFWEGQCYGVACAAAELIDGARAVYGHWLGGVNEEGFWGDKAGLPFIQHGWVKLPDGRVLDPTRWSFEAAAPYIFLGENEGEYDMGGQSWRKAMRPPPPPNDPEDQKYTLTLSRGALDTLNGLLGRTPSSEFGNKQLFWLANAPLDDLHPHAREFYVALIACEDHMQAYIPIDHQHDVGL